MCPRGRDVDGRALPNLACRRSKPHRRGLCEFCHPADQDQVTQILSQALDGKPFDYEHRLKRGDNRDLRIVHGRGEAAAMNTANRSGCSAHSRHHRTQAYGGIVASRTNGINRSARRRRAHDFNNLLTVIAATASCCLAILIWTTTPSRRVGDQTGGQTPAALTQQLLAFSRQQLVSQHPGPQCGLGETEGCSAA